MVGQVKDLTLYFQKKIKIKKLKMIFYSNITVKYSSCPIIGNFQRHGCIF